MIFGHLIEEVRFVVEGGGSRRSKSDRQASAAGEAAYRSAKKRHRVFPTPDLDRDMTKSFVRAGDKRTKQYSRKVLLSPPYEKRSKAQQWRKERSESLFSEGGGSRSDKAARQDAFLRKATGSMLQRDKKTLRRWSWDKHGHADDPGSVFVAKDGREPSHPRTTQKFLKTFGAKINAKTNKRKVVGPSGKLPG